MSVKSAFKKYRERRRESLSFYISGIVLLVLSLSLVPSAFMALLLGEDLMAPGLSMVVGMILGTLFLAIHKLPRSATPVNVLFMLGMIWTTTILFGAFPYVLAGVDVFSAIFESTSGYTTTGGSAIADLSVIPDNILLYRTMTNWIGGIIIIISVMILLPMVGSSNRTIISNEISGSGIENMHMRIRDSAIQFIQIYMVLSVAQCVILMSLSMKPIEAISVTFSTISTGGFSTFPMTDYNIAYDFVITLFMFLGATNFYLHFKAVYTRSLKCYVNNEEFKLMAFWYVFASTVIFILAYHDVGMTIENYVHSMFMVVSSGTTTGFACTDYTPWPMGAVVLIFIVAIIGGSCGSTAGGIKIIRLLIILKCIPAHIKNIVSPNSVTNISVDNQRVPDPTIHNALDVAALFIVTIVFFTIMFMALGMDAGESITSVVTAVSNYGPSINQFGPMGSFASMSPVFKLLMSFLMWAGRLEIILAFAMFMPSVWKEQARSVSYSRELRK